MSLRQRQTRSTTIPSSRAQRLTIPALLGYALIGFWATVGTIVTGTDWSRIKSLDLLIQSRFLEVQRDISPVAPPKEVIILAIDDDSFNQAKEFYQSNPKKYASLEGLRVWPWKRSAYVEAIEKLIQAGAKVVAVDIVFIDPSASLEDDQNLEKLLKRYPDRIVLAALFNNSYTSAGEKLNLETPEALFPGTPLTMGLINFELEPNSRIHRLPDLHQAEFQQSLGLENKIPPFYRATLKAANLPHPEVQGKPFIYFYGPEYTFKRVSFWEVLHPDNWQVLLQDQIFKDKIVLIGPTATDLQDFQLTPLGRMAGIEIHANALATVLENRMSVEAIPNPMLRGLLVFLGVIGSGTLLSLIPKQTVGRFLWAVGIALTWGLMSYFSFTIGRVIFPTAVPMLCISLGGLSYLTVGAVTDQLEQRRLRRTLERYVAAPIVQEILLNYSGDFQSLLKGKKVEAAILFCDIRGFTTLSYKLEPEQLIEQLNVYFNAMVNVILDAGGTLDKFIGDAVMAEFGSPISSGAKTDAMNAIKAALGMRKALNDLRQQWKQQDQVMFFNGIGLNFGEMIVGDIGSERRREFAAIGDAVNVASRVEGMTKNFWTDILLTESMYELVQDEIEAQDVGVHALKGREAPVRMYSLIGLKGDDHRLYQQVCEDLRQYLGGVDGKSP